MVLHRPVETTTIFGQGRERRNPAWEIISEHSRSSTNSPKSKAATRTAGETHLRSSFFLRGCHSWMSQPYSVISLLRSPKNTTPLG